MKTLIAVNDSGLPMVISVVDKESKVMELLKTICDVLFEKKRIVASPAVMVYEDMTKKEITVVKMGVLVGKVGEGSVIEKQGWLLEISTTINSEEFERSDSLDLILETGYRYLVRKVVQSSIYTLIENMQKEWKKSGNL